MQQFLYHFLIPFDMIDVRLLSHYSSEGDSMPTNKTPFTFHMKDEYLEKMRYIAERETRSWNIYADSISKSMNKKMEKLIYNKFSLNQKHDKAIKRKEKEKWSK